MRMRRGGGGGFNMVRRIEEVTLSCWKKTNMVRRIEGVTLSCWKKTI
jgi:hypothetical protein